jgi:hypothetical protein
MNSGFFVALGAIALFLLAAWIGPGEKVRLEKESDPY